MVRATKPLETAAATAFAWNAGAGCPATCAVDTGERHVQRHAVDGHDPALLRRTGFGVCTELD
jgi:hypothetical protein